MAPVDADLGVARHGLALPDHGPLASAAAVLRSRWLPGLVVAAVILLVAFLFAEASSSAGGYTAVSFGEQGPRPVVGAPAPAFEAVDLEGMPVRLADYRGRPVWINFWATWCPPCRAEMPDIAAVYQEARERGLVLLAVSVAEDRETVRTYLRRTGLDVPALVDETGSVAARYGLMGFPTHYFIDSDGTVRDIRVGGLSQKAIRERLAAIMPVN